MPCAPIGATEEEEEEEEEDDDDDDDTVKRIRCYGNTRNLKNVQNYCT
jgi:hypothetical protein